MTKCINCGYEAPPSDLMATERYISMIQNKAQATEKELLSLFMVVMNHIDYVVGTFPHVSAMLTLMELKRKIVPSDNLKSIIRNHPSPTVRAWFKQP